MATLPQKNYAPRQGILGVWDTIVGPKMSLTETLVCALPTLVATIYIPCYAIIHQLQWNNIQLILSAILAFDLFGGAIVNITPTSKRWHHRSQNGWPNYFGFVLIHLHPILITLFYGASCSFFVKAYSYLILSASIILFSPKYFQKAIAISLYLGSLILSSDWLPAIDGMEWFLPVYFLKLLVSYLPEEPFTEE
jgi:uncharacterized membrane protein YhaH (DUF805 family)